MKGIAVLAVATALLAGCAGISDTMAKAAGLGVVTQKRSTFDNATVVNVTPTWLVSEGSWGNMVKLGARWSSAAPDSVTLILAYDSNISSGNAYIGLNSLQVNIDGEISSYSAGPSTDFSSSSYNSVSKTIYTTSKNSVVVPYATLQRMVSAKDCRLRIHTNKGYEDSQFSIERYFGGAMAILSIKEFMAKVDPLRKQ